MVVSWGTPLVSHDRLRQQTVQRATRRLLLCLFLGSARATRQAILVHPHFHLKLLLVVGTRFPDQAVLGGRLAASLQIFLKGGLAVRLREIFAAFLESKVEQSAAEHLAGGFQPSIEVYRGNHSFKCVGQERGLFPAGGLFFATAQSQVFTETQALRGPLPRAGIPHAG